MRLQVLSDWLSCLSVHQTSARWSCVFWPICPLTLSCCRFSQSLRPTSSPCWRLSGRTHWRKPTVSDTFLTVLYLKLPFPSVTIFTLFFTPWASGNKPNSTDCCVDVLGSFSPETFLISDYLFSNCLSCDILNLLNFIFSVKLPPMWTFSVSDHF